jgi:hypothetical protein
MCYHQIVLDIIITIIVIIIIIIIMKVPVKGRADRLGNYTLWFASRGNLEAFANDTQHFAPALGGEQRGCVIVIMIIKEVSLSPS